MEARATHGTTQDTVSTISRCEQKNLPLQSCRRLNEHKLGLNFKDITKLRLTRAAWLLRYDADVTALALARLAHVTLGRVGATVGAAEIADAVGLALHATVRIVD